MNITGKRLGKMPIKSFQQPYQDSVKSILTAQFHKQVDESKKQVLASILLLKSRMGN